MVVFILMLVSKFDVVGCIQLCKWFSVIEMWTADVFTADVFAASICGSFEIRIDDVLQLPCVDDALTHSAISPFEGGS